MTGLVDIKQEEDGSLVIQLLVIPRSSRDRVDGFTEDGLLKVHVGAAPEGGKANKHLINFLAKAMQVKKSQLLILSGEKSRYKSLRIEGVAIDDLKKAIEEA